jgi:hypothetical protein
VVHFTYAKGRGIGRVVEPFKRWIPYAVILLARRFLNLLRGRSVFAPHMQMNSYALNRLFLDIQTAGVLECHSRLTDHGGALGVVLFFRKPRAA